MRACMFRQQERSNATATTRDLVVRYHPVVRTIIPDWRSIPSAFNTRCVENVPVKDNTTVRDDSLRSKETSTDNDTDVESGLEDKTTSYLLVNSDVIRGRFRQSLVMLIDGNSRSF
jgi:hypothetical protein